MNLERSINLHCLQLGAKKEQKSIEEKKGLNQLSHSTCIVHKPPFQNDQMFLLAYLGTGVKGRSANNYGVRRKRFVV